MDITLNSKELRLLCDLVYVGNWIINSQRGSDRIEQYDKLESMIFGTAFDAGMSALAERGVSNTLPSREYVDGGIHEVIMDYEDEVFFSILAEELARRDMKEKDVEGVDKPELDHLIKDYIYEFELNGIDNVNVEGFK